MGREGDLILLGDDNARAADPEHALSLGEVLLLLPLRLLLPLLLLLPAVPILFKEFVDQLLSCGLLKENGFHRRPNYLLCYLLLLLVLR